MKRIGISFAMAVGVFAGAAVFEQPVAVAQSSTTGTVRGRIVDKSTKDAVVGATVSVSGPALQGQQAEITDDNGEFALSNLPPGDYVLTVFYNNAQFSRPNVRIEVGKQAFVRVPIDTTVQTSEVIELEGRTPIVDQGSTKIGSTITDEYTRNVPTGRTFGAVLGTAAGTQGDQYGVSFSGSTSAESSYVVEGINTTDTAFGGQSTNLPNEFVEETEVIAGGYSAEFGRSTGGVINVVTKQGSNKLKGSIFGYYTPGATFADAKPILRQGSSIGSELNTDYQADLGFEIGGPILKDKLWFHVGYNPSFNKQTFDRITSRNVDVNQDGAADTDEDTGLSVLEEVARLGRARFQNTQFFTAKINGAISANHQFQVSGFGNPRGYERDFYRLTGDPYASLYKVEDGAYDVAGKWTSKLANGKTQIDLVGGYHLGYKNQDPLFGDGRSRSALQFRNLRTLDQLSDFETNYDQRCDDGTAMAPNGDMYPLIQNCPVVNYTTNGVGFLETRQNGRISGTASLTQRVKLLGHHTFKLGADLEQTTYNSDRGYTGDSFYEWRRPPAINGVPQPRQWRRRVYLEVDPTGTIPCLSAGTMCKTAEGGIQADTKNRNLGFYLQDAWEIRPNVTLNAGVRYERQTGYAAEAIQGVLSPSGEVVPEKAYDLKNMIAPRIGLIWDPTQEGRSKLIAHYGRFYESVPMDINVRAFGGEITDESYLSCPDATINANQAQLAACQTFSKVDQLGGGTEYFAPSTKGQYINEIILGGEYEVMADFKVGLNYVARNMPVVIEDMSTDGGNSYIIANPGEDFSDDATSLRTQAAAQMAAGRQDLADLYLSRAERLEGIVLFDKPIRDYQAVQLTAEQRFSKRAMLLASYTYSRSRGNYPGLFSTETGQLDPNLTSLYDLPELMSNRYGSMGLDRPHLLKVDGFYQFDLEKAGVVTFGASFRAQSGIPHNTLGAHPVYGPDESYLLPRGSASRSPVTFNTDVKLTYGRRIGKTQTIEIFADVFNLVNRQEETDADETYTTEALDPIVGGDASDLRHAKAGGTGTSPEVSKNYLNLNARQSPRSVRFGLRYTF